MHLANTLRLAAYCGSRFIGLKYTVRGCGDIRAVLWTVGDWAEPKKKTIAGLDEFKFSYHYTCSSELLPLVDD